MVNSNSGDKHLISINDRGGYLQISRIIQGNEKIKSEYTDIRLMYTTVEGELKPTNEGIKIPSEMYPRIVFEMFLALGDEYMQKFFDYATPEKERL